MYIMRNQGDIMNKRYPNFQKKWINPTITCLHMLDQFGIIAHFYKKDNHINYICRVNAMGDLLRDCKNHVKLTPAERLGMVQ